MDIPQYQYTVYNFKRTFDVFAHGKEYSCAPILFQLRPLAVALQSDKVKSANFLKFHNRLFWRFWHTLYESNSHACRIM